MIKKTAAGRQEKKLSRENELLVDLIRKAFVLMAAQIAKTEKAEDMLKMILRSDEGETSNANRKELWQLLEKVRREVLKKAPGGRTASTAKRKAPGRTTRKSAGR
ncbi:MAG: hypothetical protein GY867_10675 [bacterium]|nr:hypothetical protein [bacterium]